MNPRTAYTVVMPTELQPSWFALARPAQRLLQRRLRRAARSAWANPTVWPAGEPGIHRGRHRARVGGLWLLYQLDDQALTLKLLGFGQHRDGAGEGR